MRIAILGAGAVGSVLGSLLWRAGEDVVLVGRAAHVAAIRAAGLDVQGVMGGFSATPHAQERLDEKPDLALLTVKTHDVVTVLRENAPIGLMREGIRVAERAGVRLASLPGTSVPLVRLIEFAVTLLRRVAGGRRFLTAREIEHAFDRECRPAMEAKRAA